MNNFVAVLLVGLSSTNVYAVDDEVKTFGLKSVPTEERAFVDTVGTYTKAQVVELLGEPAKAEDVKLIDSGRIVASVWHYHNINTDANGTYYPTTELDFVDDKVVTVVFLNNDGTETEIPAQPYTPPSRDYFEGDGTVERLEPNI